MGAVGPRDRSEPPLVERRAVRGEGHLVAGRLSAGEEQCVVREGDVDAGRGVDGRLVRGGRTDIGDATRDGLRAGELADHDVRLVEVARIDPELSALRRIDVLAGTAQEADVVGRRGVVHETGIERRVDVDMAGPDVERACVDDAVGVRHQRRLDRCGGPIGMRRADHGGKPGDVRRRHRRTADRIELPARCVPEGPPPRSRRHPAP